ncbi:cysteine-rich CWC family protein [Pseudomonas sp. TWR3-1-1]|uniref:cysteine-rich CWC family protein n=1 Tax=Pseudomonas sp. TWR3-1-1 TaxID=2804633 RepID=UPI003CF5002E
MSTPSLCPACGASNQCAMVGNDEPSASPCWCFKVTIDPNVIEALAPELRNATCLCPRCAGVLKQLAASNAGVSR